MWDLQENGTVTIRFYGNDTLGNIRFAEIDVKKDIIAPKFLNITGIKMNSTYGSEPPSFSLDLDDDKVDKIWYVLEGKRLKPSGLRTSVYNRTFCNKTGTIDRQLWNNVSDGEVIITFYINDTLGNQNTQEIKVQKSTSPTEEEPTALDNFIAFLTSPIGIAASVGVAAGAVGTIVLGAKWGDIAASRARKAAAKMITTGGDPNLTKQSIQKGSKITKKQIAKRRRKSKFLQLLEEQIEKATRGLGLTTELSTEHVNALSLLGQFASVGIYGKLKKRQTKELMKAMKKGRHLKYKDYYARRILFLKIK